VVQIFWRDAGDIGLDELADLLLDDPMVNGPMIKSRLAALLMTGSERRDFRTPCHGSEPCSDVRLESGIDRDPRRNARPFSGMHGGEICVHGRIAGERGGGGGCLESATRRNTRDGRFKPQPFPSFLHGGKALTACVAPCLRQRRLPEGSHARDSVVNHQRKVDAHAGAND
jgi:hypothetical protein